MRHAMCYFLSTRRPATIDVAGIDRAATTHLLGNSTVHGMVTAATQILVHQGQ